jgi:hypothetical protein
VTPTKRVDVTYCPIVLPVVALAIWFLVVLLTAIPSFVRLAFAEDFDPPLTKKQKARNSKRSTERFATVMQQPVLYYVICFALAHIGAGGGLASWLAWAFAISWAATRPPVSLSNKHLRCGAHSVSSISMYALAVYAGIQITRDLLAASG